MLMDFNLYQLYQRQEGGVQVIDEKCCMSLGPNGLLLKAL